MSGRVADAVLIAIERSTACGSAALFSSDGTLMGSVEDNHRGQGDAFGLVRALLEKTGVDLTSVDGFAVGIGPGSFSGIRSAIAVLSGLALPIGATIRGVSSAAATAAVFRIQNPEAGLVAVVGDARRGHIWVSLLEAGASGSHTVNDFCLVDRTALAMSIPGHAAVVTPDGERLSALLAADFAPERVHFMNPTAEAVGKLALAGCSGTALPIYLHPAVMPPIR